MRLRRICVTAAAVVGLSASGGMAEDDALDFDMGDFGHFENFEGAPAKKPEVGIPIESENLDAMTSEQRESMVSESHEFQAEVYRLMDIIINSIYTKKEVFLRELISNAADALEKVRFLAIEDSSILGDKKDLTITVEYDQEAKTVTIADTGVGMTKADLINNLGTVAKSGTSNFLEAIAQGGDVNLIGQFGVGFYSAFLVADRVTVTSKSNDDPDQHIWTSTADASFTVAKDPRGDTLGRGTRITLHLKDDSLEYLQSSTLDELLKKYSQFVDFPIYLRVEKKVEEEVPVEEEEKEKKEGDEDDVQVGEDEDAEDKPKTKKVTKTVHELVRKNEQKPIWMRPKEEVTEEEYLQFYRTLVKDENAPPPLTYIHFAAEGEIEFKGLLYIPSKPASDPYQQYFTRQHDIKLYVRRVLVSEKFEDIIPSYLNFIKGVIDSDDLPLKVDRESVSQLKVIDVISNRVTRKVLDVLRKMGNDADNAQSEIAKIEQTVTDEGRMHTDSEAGEDVIDYSEEEQKQLETLRSTSEKYEKFWDSFGRNIKLGCVDDKGSNRTKIGKLLRYFSTKSTDKVVSLQHVISRMPEEQSVIYYHTGESTKRLMESPLLQGFLKKDIEVLLLSDAADEACMATMYNFEGKKLTSIEKGDVKLDQNEEEKEYFKKLNAMFRPLLTWWKEKLGGPKSGRYSRVVLSQRLVDDPVAIVASQFGRGAFEEKIVRYQTFIDPNAVGNTRVNRILEVNPQHPVIRKMKDMHAENPDSQELLSLGEELSKIGLLASGFAVDDPGYFATKLYENLFKEHSVDVPAELEQIDVSEVELTEADARAEQNSEQDANFFDMASLLKSAGEGGAVDTQPGFDSEAFDDAMFDEDEEEPEPEPEPAAHDEL